MDNIKVNIALPSVLSAKSVKSVGHRQNNNRNNFIKNMFKGRHKKKKRKNPMDIKISARAALDGQTAPTRHSAGNKNAKKFVQTRIIDIRV